MFYTIKPLLSGQSGFVRLSEVFIQFPDALQFLTFSPVCRISSTFSRNILFYNVFIKITCNIFRVNKEKLVKDNVRTLTKSNFSGGITLKYFLTFYFCCPIILI